jgi:hypothetical protein
MIVDQEHFVNYPVAGKLGNSLIVRGLNTYFEIKSIKAGFVFYENGEILII